MSKSCTQDDCWIVSDVGKVGTLNQCVGLAEGLGYAPKIIEIKAKAPWSLLPASCWMFPLMGTTPSLAPPWPKLIIAAGRASVSPTAEIRRLSGGATKVVQLQNPRVDPSLFDAIIAPAHDKLSAPNVITTKGALHRVTRERIMSDVARFESNFKDLPKPYTAVLIGGTNRCYTVSPQVITSLVQTLKTLLSQQGGSLVITISRRTEPENIEALKDALKDTPHYLWDGQSENPYFALLGIADCIVVTSDSVSMTSEACSLGTPVCVYHLPGGSKKFKAFHHSFERFGLTRPFDGSVFLDCKHSPLFEMDDVIQKLTVLLS